MPAEIILEKQFAIEIEKHAPPGQGLGFHAGRAVFVPGAMPGELVLVEAETIKPKYALASLQKILRPAAERRYHACPHYDDCGGCDLLHLEYPAQLSLKKSMLLEVLRLSDPSLCVREVFGLGEAQSRHRVILHYDESRRQFGFYRRRRQQIVAVPQCLVMAPGLQKLLSKMSDMSVIPSGTVAVQALAGRDGSYAAVFRCGHAFMPLPGVRGAIFEDYGSGPLELAASGFAQSNPLIVSAIQQEIATLVPDGVEVLELYGGSGTFSFVLAAGDRRVRVFESDPEAVARGRRNAERLGFNNVAFVCAHLGRRRFKLPAGCDILFVDPPRGGIDRLVLKQIMTMRPTACIYLSCNPATLARDLKYLGRSYDLKRVRAFDMYPGTSHLEVLAFLTLKS